MKLNDGPKLFLGAVLLLLLSVLLLLVDDSSTKVMGIIFGIFSLWWFVGLFAHSALKEANIKEKND